MAHALVVEDDDDSARMLAAIASMNGFSVTTAGTLKAARLSIAHRQPDIVLLDMHLPDGNGLSLLDQKSISPQSEIVLMTGYASLDSSIEALRMGASDYFVKPVDGDRLRRLLARIANLQTPSTRAGTYAPVQSGLIGNSVAMRGVGEQIERVAPTSLPVLILGESGTGKELAAQRLHQLSGRTGPFIAVNCSAFSPQLVESELFGHERGSFTGADRTHVGFFERADRGTLFLDEISEMPLAMQAKLLRVLENGVIRRVGSTDEKVVNVRTVAASNRSSASNTLEGSLRVDLFYRIASFVLKIPPLRERPEDVCLLAMHFLDGISRREGKKKTLSSEGINKLESHFWPGNVRELKSVIHKAYVMSMGEMLEPAWIDVEKDWTASAPKNIADAEEFIPGQISLEEMERRLIVATLNKFNGQRERTAASLGISLKTLYNKLKIYDRRNNADDGQRFPHFN
ncbi:sigma-54 dependent transcriptional regulator [uncultured Xylophilus sp.]|uniref:sigma-54-dependent transcriptional regulator n=1 Tax=uncultured Xylophilus sp. TaxID=296832 RepID=UPI0025EEF19A|nr:sigma-54 dependent transcriptional regulator [uncultured Xylophilus sp.]